MKSGKFAEKASGNFIDEVNKYIYSRLHRPLSISELAKKFSYSASHFRAVYRKEMGISVGRYIKEMKLCKAQSYLGTTDMSVSEIAEACGYESLYSFSHAFKNYMKMSPADFRRKVNK
jgi:AraC-like DNA-binding protein